MCDKYGEVVSHFFTQVEERFAFVASTLHFAPPEQRRGPAPTVTYKARHIAIEVTLDWETRLIQCTVAQINNGKLVKGWERNKYGYNAREYLSVLIDRIRMIPPEDSKSHGYFAKLPSNYTIQQYIESTVESYAAMLKGEGSIVLSDLPFFGRESRVRKKQKKQVRTKCWVPGKPKPGQP